MTDQSGTTPPAPGEDPRVPRLGGATAYTPSDAAPQPPYAATSGQLPDAAPAPQPPAYGAPGGYQAPAQHYGAASSYQTPAPTQPYAAAGYEGQAPYGAPAQPPYGAHNPYAQQSQDPAGYGAPVQGMPPAPAPYGYAPGQYPPGYSQAPARSGILGTIGLALVTIAGVAITVMGYLLGQLAVQFVELQQTVGTNTPMDANDPRVQQFIQQNPWMMFATPVFLIGLAGFIISIVAFASRRGRKQGLWGILLGIAFPIVSLVVMVMTMSAYLQR